MTDLTIHPKITNNYAGLVTVSISYINDVDTYVEELRYVMGGATLDEDVILNDFAGSKYNIACYSNPTDGVSDLTPFFSSSYESSNLKPTIQLNYVDWTVRWILAGIMIFLLVVILIAFIVFAVQSSRRGKNETQTLGDVAMHSVSV